ncbi:DUF3152 domain-containing protein [Amycolatopsis sp. NPDC059021]|uniref:DUF3152 domain-containing protein n=1 Tax=Amycolatopsis sp. NPDC059021 TaxID=3346704 RepID=UPI00366A5C7D
MDRVKSDARGDEQRTQYVASSRRSAHGTGRGSPVPPRTGQYRPTATPPQRVGEDRYRPGGRRTSAEPLRASWKPQAESEPDEPRRKPVKRGKFGTFAKTYGWRVYALPILVVITALVVFNTATGPAEPIAQEGRTSAAAESGTGSGPKSGTAVLPENPAKPVNLNIPTAELPKGGDFTQAGKGTFHVVPGSGPKIGQGKLYTYTVEVEDGIDPASYAGDDSFGNAVQGILSDPRSWTFDGKKALQRVDASFPNPTFRVTLTTPETNHRPDVCGYSITYETSCYTESFQRRVVINLARWVRGAIAFGGDMTGYRQYAINHEVGHALGGVHVPCPVNDGPAPVMMQQTLGVADNYVAQLNDLPGGDRNAVPADGKTCKPNAWPSPNP